MWQKINNKYKMKINKNNKYIKHEWKAYKHNT